MIGRFTMEGEIMNSDYREKRADNVILNKKIDIQGVEDQICFEKENLNIIDDSADNYYLLNKSINKCVALLFTSIRGKQTQNILADIGEENNKTFVDAMNRIDDEKQMIRGRIKDLYDKKEEILKDNRDEEESEEEKKNE